MCILQYIDFLASGLRSKGYTYVCRVHTLRAAKISTPHYSLAQSNTRLSLHLIKLNTHMANKNSPYLDKFVQP